VTDLTLEETRVKNLKIIPTQYSREDGLEIFRINYFTPNGKFDFKNNDEWFVRARRAIPYFYNKECEWIIAHVVDLKDIEAYGWSFDKAMELLETLPEIDRSQ
jgi:hypothetical protein